MSTLELAGSFLLTLALHATVLLGAVWLAERFGWLRNLAWAELAWRAALFGALLSASLEFVSLPRTWLAATPEIAQHALATFPDAASGESTAATVAAASNGPAAVAAGTVDGSQAWNSPRPRPEANASRRATPQAAAIPLPEVAVLLALGLWLAGIALGALRLARQALALRRFGHRLRTRGEPAGAALEHQSARLADELGIPAPLLRLSPMASSPMVLPGASVLLPTWSQALEPRQQRALLAHELSHLQRRDPAWRIAQRMALLPLFFHPLAWHARRRLESLAEDACDARAAQLLGSGRPLAECLATCLSHAGARAGQPALAVAMAGDAGPVLRRVRQLLEDAPMSLRPVSPALRRTALALGLVALVALPGLAITTFASEAFADNVWSGVSRGLLGNGNTYSYRSNNDGETLKLTMRGEVEFNAAESDVVRLGRGSDLELAEKRRGTQRRLHVFGKDGVIQRRYWLDGKEQPLDADGRAWLARLLPQVIRESGINADARGKRLLAEGGPDALLAEIAKIESDHAAARYLAVLFANATLDDARMQRALQVTQAIDSDFERRQALQDALSSQKLSIAQQGQLLGLAAEIGSDFELAQLLVSVTETHALKPELVTAWRAALAGIGSDFEKRRVLEALLAEGKSSPAAIPLALDSAADIGSDFELRQVLEKAARYTRGNPAAQAAYLQRCAEIGSDFEQREALVALLEAGPVDLAIANGVLDSVGNVGSDFEAAQVLQTLAGAMPNDAALIERYRAAARQLGDFERGRSEKALDRFVAGS